MKGLLVFLVTVLGSCGNVQTSSSSHGEAWTFGRESANGIARDSIRVERQSRPIRFPVEYELGDDTLQARAKSLVMLKGYPTYHGNVEIDGVWIGCSGTLLRYQIDALSTQGPIEGRFSGSEFEIDASDVGIASVLIQGTFLEAVQQEGADPTLCESPFLPKLVSRLEIEVVNLDSTSIQIGQCSNPANIIENTPIPIVFLPQIGRREMRNVLNYLNPGFTLTRAGGAINQSDLSQWDDRNQPKIEIINQTPGVLEIETEYGDHARVNILPFSTVESFILYPHLIYNNLHSLWTGEQVSVGTEILFSRGIATFAEDICLNEVEPNLQSKTSRVCTIQNASSRIVLAGRGAQTEVMSRSVKIESVGECQIVAQTSAGVAQSFTFSVKP